MVGNPLIADGAEFVDTKTMLSHAKYDQTDGRDQNERHAYPPHSALPDLNGPTH